MVVVVYRLSTGGIEMVAVGFSLLVWGFCPLIHRRDRNGGVVGLVGAVLARVDLCLPLIHRRDRNGGCCLPLIHRRDRNGGRGFLFSCLGVFRAHPQAG